jgi:hypothetical protein
LDSLFADRYDETLNEIIATEQMEPESTVADLRKEILNWYDGYVFDGRTTFDETTSDKTTRVLNPFSIVNFFDETIFKDYWLQAVPPSFLTTIIANNLEFFNFNPPLRVPKDYLSAFITFDVSPIPILFQTGYLTLNGVFLKNKKEPYTLKIPNMEVERGYPIAFYQAYFGPTDINELISTGKIFRTAVLKRDAAAIEKLLETSLAKLSSERHIPMEQYYHSVIQAFINGMGIDAGSQVSSFMGKSDLDLVFSDNVNVIIEVKFEKEPLNSSDLTIEDKRRKARSLAQKALEQIFEKERSKHYFMEEKEVVELGLGVFGRSKVGVLMRDGKNFR